MFFVFFNLLAFLICFTIGFYWIEQKKYTISGFDFGLAIINLIFAFINYSAL